MVKTRNDFPNEDSYLDYTRSLEFLKNYNIEGKTAKEIQEEMRIDKDWLHYIEKALPILKEKNKLRGIDLIYLVDHYVIENEDYDAWLETVE